MEDAPAAAWVTGVPAPDPGRPIVLMARLEKREGPTLLRAVQVLTLGQGKTKVFSVGWRSTEGQLVREYDLTVE